MRLYLIPRLNYNFSFRDLLISFIGIFKSNLDFQKISALFNTDNIYFTNHARTGLRLLLNSFELPPNARIGVQILNCHTVFNAIIKAGFKPVFIDINDSLTISLEDLKKKSDQIDALIVTNIFGIPSEIEKIKDIIKDKLLIEDCAHSFLSSRNGELTGTSSDAAIFSFGKAKFPSIGSGGFVIINNETIIPKFMEYFSKLEENNFLFEIKNVIRSFGLKILHNRFIYRFFTFPFVKKLGNKFELTLNYDSVEKKVLKSNLSVFLYKINSYESYKVKQVQNAVLLKKYLKQYDYLDTIELDDKLKPNYIMLPVITNNKDKLISSFYKMGIEIGPHFYKSLEWAKELGYKKNDCKNAERLIYKLVIFPTYKLFNINNK